MNKSYYNELRNLNEDIFVKKVARFLMILENVYPKLIAIEEIEKEFGKDSDRIVEYLRSGRSEKDHLIIGDGSGWRINNWNIDRVQKFISRVVQEDSILEQVNLQKRQVNFNKYLLLATTVIALIGFYQISNKLLDDLGIPDWQWIVIIFVGLTILAIIFRLIYLLFKKQFF